MDKMKQWIALTVLGALVIAAGGWFLVVSPKRSSAADLRTQAASKETANRQLMMRLDVLKAQAKDLPKKQATLAAVAAKIPATPAMPSLIRALNDAAGDADVELVSMAPGAATAMAPAAAPAVATGGAATPAVPGAAAVNVGTLQQIPVTLNVVGSYFAVAQYLDRLENLERAFRVTGFSLAPGANPVKPTGSQPSTDSGKVLTAAITGLVFDTTGGSTSSLTAAK